MFCRFGCLVVFIAHVLIESYNKQLNVGRPSGVTQFNTISIRKILKFCRQFF